MHMCTDLGIDLKALEALLELEDGNSANDDNLFTLKEINHIFKKLFLKTAED